MWPWRASWSNSSFAVAESVLNVARVRRRTCTNGPGWRSAVWVQGCKIRCSGCFNPDTHAHEARRFWEPEQLSRWMMDADVEGVTILGGEPFEQADACARLAEVARALGGSVVTYSGYTWAFLRNSRLPEVQRLLAATDLLIAGPFVQARPTDGRAWHGSTNQDFVFLSDRYDQRVLEAAQDLPVIEVWADSRTASWSGIPGGGDVLPLG